MKNAPLNHFNYYEMSCFPVWPHNKHNQTGHYIYRRNGGEKKMNDE